MSSKLVQRLISLVLVISTLLSFSGLLSASASSDIKKGYINDNNVYVRTSPTTTKDNKIKHNGNNLMLDSGHEVSVIETVDSDGDSNYKTWHRIKFKYDGVSYEGYVYADFVRIVNTPSGDIELPEDVPEIYKDYIADIVAAHPNWTFKFYDTGIEWSTLVSNDAQGDPKKSMIYKTFPLSYRSTESGCYNWKTDTWIATDSGGWYHANDETIFHYMDPRNFFTEENIFMFEALSYDEKTQTIDGVEKILTGSFMEGKTIKNTNGEKVSYAQAYMDAAKISGVSPFHLASRTIQEVGAAGSGSTSGTYSGYYGYYNFYNIGAVSGSNPIAAGLRYASGSGSSASEKAKYMLPWNSPYKAIVGGAKWIGDGYINNNQDTLYYQKFNVVNKNWNHQYMANITAPATEASHIKKTYSNLGILDHSFTFIIPYYRNMPTKACELPVASYASPNNWLSSLTIDGYKLTFDAAKTSGYSLTIDENVSSIKISATTVNSKATVSGVGNISLKKGINHLKITVKAENGDIRTYTIDVTRGNADYNDTVILGDANGDGKVTSIDARWALQVAAGQKTLSEQGMKNADTNNDGKITSIDARNILQIVSQA